MSENKTIIKELEQRFALFRWALIVFMAPITMSLSDFHKRGIYIGAILVLGAIYNLIITFAAFSKNSRFTKILHLTIYFDIPFVSILLFIRGGMRSDVYLLYYLVILYYGAKSGFKGTINSLIQSIIYYTIAAFFFTATKDFDLNRYLIRLCYLIILSVVMYEVNHQIYLSRVKEKIALEKANQDPLTGLPNRLMMSETYERLCNFYHEQLAIILIDFDNFKQINDKQGHAYGDEVLKQISSIFKHFSNEQDFICRFGGDEFLAFFGDVEEHQAFLKADTIRKEIEKLDFKGYQLTISIGINMVKREHSMIENINLADEAMYHAKNKGKNQVSVYNKEWK